MSMTDGAAPAAASTEGLSIEDAVGRMTGAPVPDEEPATVADDGDDGAADYGSDPDGDDAAADDDQHPGETEDDDAAGDDQPPIEPPKSLTKAEKELFKSLPRDVQETWANRERDREAYYRKGHDEAVAKARAAEAQAQAAEQARQQYEAALPQLYAKLYGDFQTKFGDIKSQTDVEAMRQNDPMRWMEYRDGLENLRETHRQSEAARQRQAQESQQRFQTFTQAEDAKFLEKRPEFSDPQKAAKLQNEVATMLVDDYGFSPEELTAAWNNGGYQTLRDHRWQLIITDALAYRTAKAKAKDAARKPVPPVQRPGTSPTKGEAQAVDLKILKDKLARSGREEDAVALLMARGRKRA